MTTHTERARQWRLDNLERSREQQRKSAKKIRARLKETNPEKFFENLRKARLSRYKLSLEEYERIREAQKGLCAICGNPETAILCGRVKQLSVFVRKAGGFALLCTECHAGVSRLKKDPALLRRAADYLEGAGH